GPPLIYRIAGGAIKELVRFPQIQYPSGMKADAAGNLYVADSGRVLKISPAGTITPIAGSYMIGGFSGDGGPATSAQLNMDIGGGEVGGGGAGGGFCSKKF